MTETQDIIGIDQAATVRQGGRGYWNKTRVHFPETFALRARTERIIGATSLRNGDGSRLYLDELQPGDGIDVPEPDIDCGLFCGQYTELLDVTVGATRKVGAPC